MDAKEVLVIKNIPPRGLRSSGCCGAQPGRAVPGVPAGGRRGGADRGGGGVGGAVDQGVPRGPRSAHDRRRREHGVHPDRAGRSVRPIPFASRTSSLPRSTGRSRCRGPASPRSSVPTGRCARRRIRRASARGPTSGPSRADEGRAWFGDADIDGMHSLVGQVPILSSDGEVLAVASVSERLSVGVGAAERGRRTPADLSRAWCGAGPGGVVAAVAADQTAHPRTGGRRDRQPRRPPGGVAAQHP